MTIIVYKNGIMAADSGAYFGDTLGSYRRKIKRNDAGDLACASGNSDFCHAFGAWFVEGELGDPPTTLNQDDKTQNEAMIVRASGRVYFMNNQIIYPTEQDWGVTGSGSTVALGALYAGGDAVKAVKAAIVFDCHCGGDILAMDHHGGSSTYKFGPTL